MESQYSCDDRRSALGAAMPGRPAGVRIAAVDQNGTPDAVAQMQAVKRDRCRDDLIGREYAGDRTAAVRNNEREIK